jgi:hypothetical protein
MDKWVITALELGESNLEIILRHKLTSYQPYAGGNWASSLHWFTFKHHASKEGSKVWKQTARS